MDTRVYMMELISLCKWERFYQEFSVVTLFLAVEIELYKSDYALSCLTFSPGGYISNRIEFGLIWKALPDACLFLPEGDDQLSLGRPARLCHLFFSSRPA